MVLPLALFFLVIQTTLLLAFLSMSGYEPAVAANHASSSSALYVAEAGIAHARDVLPGTDINALLTAGGQLFAAQAFGTGNYTVIVKNNAAADPGGADPGGANNDTDGILVLTATGTFQGATREVKLEVKRASDSPFKWGAYGKISLTMGGSGSMSDSYDSAQGAYNAGTAHSKGNLASDGSITLNSATVVKGDVTAGGSVTNPGGVTGIVTQNAPQVPDFPVLDCPTGAYTPASAVPITDSHITYNASTGVLKVGGGVNLTLSAPPTSYYFSQVILSGGSTMTINTGGNHVDFFVSDLLTVGGGGILNTSAPATALTIKACGNPTKPATWAISGGSGSYFAVYAPNHQVTVGGGGDLWGAVIASEVNNTGGSKFHYDEALARQQWSASNKFSIVAGTWREF
jgi:hypothetical protein